MSDMIFSLFIFFCKHTSYLNSFYFTLLLLAPLGVYYQTNFWPLAFWCRHVMFFDQGDLFSVCFNFWPNRFLWATIVLYPTTNHSWTQEINGIYSRKENLLLIWSHKSWLGILIKIVLKKISWLVFSLFIVLKFPTIACKNKNDFSIVFFFHTCFDALDIWHCSFYYEIFSTAMCFYDKEQGRSAMQ